MPKEKKGSIFEEETEEEQEITEKEDQFLDEPTENPEAVNVYSEEGREELVEKEEMEPWEQGFVEGATEIGKVHCAHCGNLLNEKEEEIVERRINGQIYYFCGNECASKGVKHAKKR